MAAALVALALAHGWMPSPRAQEPATPIPANWEGHPTWSPDGRRIAFESDRAGNLDIVIRDVVTGSETPFTRDPANDTAPSWTPAGDCIAFRSERDGGGVFVQCEDGAARRVAADGHEPRWSPDGSRILYATSGDGPPALHVVSRDGGTPATVLGALTSTLVGPVRAVWTPDARVLLIGTHPQHGVGLWLLPADATEVTPPAARLSRLLNRTRSRNPPAFQLARDGASIYVGGGRQGQAALYRFPIDPRTGALQGGPQPIADWPGVRADAALSPDGARLAVAIERQAVRILVVPFDQASATLPLDRLQRVGPDDGDSVFPDFSPDGTALLYTVLRGAGTSELRVWSGGTGSDLRLTADGAFRFGPRWSPDGLKLAYRWHSPTPNVLATGLRMIDLTTRRESAVTSTTAGTPFTAFGWSSDGQHVLASEETMTGAVKLVSLPVRAAPKAEREARTLAGPGGRKLWQASTSPDGRWILVNLQPVDDAWSAIAVVPAAGGSPRRLTTDDTVWDDKPRWSADGRTVFFLSRRTGEFELWRIGFDPDTGQALGAASRVSNLTSPRRHVLRGIGVLDLGLSATRLAVPVEETRSTVRLGEVPAFPLGAELALCPTKDPAVDAAMPADTDGITMPVPTVSPQPTFPERALRQGISGAVVVETLIGVDGLPRPVCAVDKLDRDLESTSLATVKRWRFRPALLHGKPVPVLATIELAFTIARDQR